MGSEPQPIGPGGIFTVSNRPIFPAAGLLLGCLACAGTPSVNGVAGVAPSANAAWTPPPSEARARDTAPAPALPPDLEQRLSRLTLADVVDIGLRNNPATRLSWANARAAAAAYGSARGAYYPTIDGEVTGTRLKTVASQGRSAVTQSVLNPSLNISYLLFDFGGRSGKVGAARNELVAANFAHNAALQGVVLDIQRAYFGYVANRALLEAQRTTLSEARTNLAAAEERNRVGVATIADVLQARTAASQAELAAEVVDGSLQTARGQLALSLGIPANLPYDIDSTEAAAPVALLADSVDALIARADALGQRVVFEVFTSYHLLQTAARRVRTSEDLIASAEQSSEVALGRYRAGVGSVLDLLSAQSALAQARGQHVLARLEWNTSLAQLAHDAGVLDAQGGNSLRLAPDSTTVTPP
jgi:outer membrane protein TolC